MSARLGALLLLLTFAFPASLAAEPESALPHVVRLLPLWPDRAPNPEEPEGSAVFIAQEGAKALLLTASHVVGDAKDFRIVTHDGEAYAASLLARDADSDLALLTAETTRAPLPLGSPPQVGDPVCAIGNAFGLGLSLSCGVVSATGRAGVGFNRIEDFVQTDAMVNPGMSGGALVDADGRLVGLLSAIFTKRSDADIGVNFAVSIALLEAALPDLKAGHAVHWPRVALALRPAKPTAVGPLGPVVARLASSGAALAAGLEVGDRLLMAAGRRILNPGDWHGQIALSESGQAIPLVVWRDSQRVTLDLRVP